MFSNRGKILWNVQQKRENAMKCSAKEGKCYKMFSKRGKMFSRREKKLRNVQQKRENAMKCSAIEGKCYEMFSNREKMP